MKKKKKNVEYKALEDKACFKSSDFVCSYLHPYCTHALGHKACHCDWTVFLSSNHDQDSLNLPGAKASLMWSLIPAHPHLCLAPSLHQPNCPFLRMLDSECFPDLLGQLFSLPSVLPLAQSCRASCLEFHATYTMRFITLCPLLSELTTLTATA